MEKVKTTTEIDSLMSGIISEQSSYRRELAKIHSEKEYEISSQQMFQCNVKRSR